MSATGCRVSRTENSKVVPTVSPIARPSNAPMARSRRRSSLVIRRPLVPAFSWVFRSSASESAALQEASNGAPRPSAQASRVGPPTHVCRGDGSTLDPAISPRNINWTMRWYPKPCESTVSIFCAPFGSARTGAHGSPVTDDRRLEAVLAQYAHRLTPVEVGKAAREKIS